MAISLEKLHGQIRTVKVRWGDETIQVMYRMNASTVREALETMELDREAARGEIPLEEAAEAMIQSLLKVLHSWDIVVDEKSGEQLPITKETLWQFDFGLLQAIAAAVAEDKRPNRKPARS